MERLRDLGDEIHQLGSVEQYLIATGRTYFRGLVYADLSRMQIVSWLRRDASVDGTGTDHIRAYILEPIIISNTARESDNSVLDARISGRIPSAWKVDTCHVG